MDGIYLWNYQYLATPHIAYGQPHRGDYAHLSDIADPARLARLMGDVRDVLEHRIHTGIERCLERHDPNRWKMCTISASAGVQTHTVDTPARAEYSFLVTSKSP